MTTRQVAAAAVAFGVAGLGSAQGVVDRGTSDFGPNSASQRYVEPGNAQFSPETALTDRFGPASASQLADLYHRSDVSRRYLYQAPGFAAVYNQSDYLTREATGLVGINGANNASGQLVAITPADIVYVLSPELLNQSVRVVDDAPLPGQVDGRLRLTPLGSTTPSTGVNGRLSTQVDGRYDAANPRVVDIAAIEQQMRGAQRDPRLVERSRRWREERERERAAAEEAARAADEVPEEVSDEDAVDDPTPAVESDED
mgnify:CR=1 FL=1